MRATQTVLATALSALPWPDLNFANPYNGQTPPFVTENFVQPRNDPDCAIRYAARLFTKLDFSIERVFGGSYLLDAPCFSAFVTLKVTPRREHLIHHSAQWQ